MSKAAYQMLCMSDCLNNRIKNFFHNLEALNHDLYGTHGHSGDKLPLLSFFRDPLNFLL